MIFRTVDGRVLGNQVSEALMGSKDEAVRQVEAGKMSLRVTANARVLAVNKGRPDVQGNVGAVYLNGGSGIEGLTLRVPRNMPPPKFSLTGNVLTVKVGDTATGSVDNVVAGLVRRKIGV